jgi:hypothetical protein
MPKKCRNPNWFSPVPFSALVARPSSFESLTEALRLAPEDFKASTLLKEWVSRNKNYKYVPLDLLEAWGFSVDVSLSKRAKTSRATSSLLTQSDSEQ